MHGSRNPRPLELPGISLRTFPVMRALQNEHAILIHVVLSTPATV